MKILQFGLCLILFLYSCNDHTPKSSEVVRIERDSVKWVDYSNKKFLLKYADMAKVEEVKKATSDGVWFNIKYPSYTATIFCTYLSINSTSIKGALDDSYQLAYGHASKASEINQREIISSSPHTRGIVYEIKGDVATPLQFYATDDQSHFLRGSIYFDEKVSTDSVIPITEYLQKDIIHLIESLEWK